MQLVSSAIFSLGHGSNDAQKTMGIIAVLLYSTGHLGGDFHIPLWVVVAAYGSIALGTYFGGWKVIKTLGAGLTDLKPVHGSMPKRLVPSLLLQILWQVFLSAQPIQSPAQLWVLVLPDGFQLSGGKLHQILLQPGFSLYLLQSW
jgi:hypothetical protein